MSEPATEDVKKIKNGGNVSVSVATNDTKAEDDFIEFSGDEEASNPVFIQLPNLTEPIGDVRVLRAIKKPRQLPNHPLAHAYSHEHPLQTRKNRLRAKEKRFALTREKRLNNRFMINTKDAWTMEERSNLINALKTHGVLDMYNLCKEVPTKTESQILEFIKAARAVTQNTLDDRMQDKNSGPERDNPIAQWLDAMEATANEKQDRFSAFNLMLPKLFLYISKYGNHPDPANCKGINYQDAYEYIYYMLSGQPGKTLTPETFRFVKKTLLNLSLLARSGSRTHLDFIESIQGAPMGLVHAQDPMTAPEPWMPKGGETPSEKMQQKALEEITKIPAANPLNVPIKILEFRKEERK